MDTSPEYVTMCMQATELQAIIAEKQTYERGAYYYLLLRSDIQYLPQSIHISRGGLHMPKIMYGFIFTQDQLQAMVFGGDMLFVDWVSWLRYRYGHMHQDQPNGYYKVFETWEQLWLAFAMYENYQKRWDGKDWVKG